MLVSRAIPVQNGGRSKTRDTQITLTPEIVHRRKYLRKLKAGCEGRRFSLTWHNSFPHSVLIPRFDHKQFLFSLNEKRARAPQKIIQPLAPGTIRALSDLGLSENQGPGNFLPPFNVFWGIFLHASMDKSAEGGLKSTTNTMMVRKNPPEHKE